MISTRQSLAKKRQFDVEGQISLKKTLIKNLASRIVPELASFGTFHTVKFNKKCKAEFGKRTWWDFEAIFLVEILLTKGRMQRN